MKKMNNSEDIISRRAFFKKAAKGVLPILGLTILGSTLISCDKDEDGNSNGCDDCFDSCSDSCFTGCKTSCDASCSTGCKGSCTTGCQYTCKTTCSRQCRSGCNFGSKN